MKTKYRGHTIEVARRQYLGSWSMLYMSIYRDCDGYCVVETFYDIDDTDDAVREMIQHMKARLDAEIADGATHEKKECRK